MKQDCHNIAIETVVTKEEVNDNPSATDRCIMQRNTSTTASDNQDIGDGSARRVTTQTTSMNGGLTSDLARYDSDREMAEYQSWRDAEDGDCLNQVDHGGMRAEGTPGMWESAVPGLGMPASAFSILDPRNAFPEGRVVGVYFDKQRRIWRANWREGGVGKRKTKNFSVDDYGFEEARRLAIEYRLLKVMEVSEKQLGGPSGATEQAALLHAELKRKTEKKESDSRGKRRRRYALTNNPLSKRSSFGSADAVRDYFGQPESPFSMWSRTMTAPVDGAAGNAAEDPAYLLKALKWRSDWDYQAYMNPTYAANGYYMLSSGECLWPPAAGGVHIDELSEVLDGTVCTSPKVVTARPVSEELITTEGISPTAVDAITGESYANGSFGCSSAENHYPSGPIDDEEDAPGRAAEEWE